MTFADPWRCHVRARWLFVRGFALLVALVAASGDSVAGQAKLAWDAAANATGYQLYYGTSSGNYASSVDAANQTTVTVSGLTDGARYYFAVKAYNSTTTSNFSTETSTVIQAPAPVVSFSANPSTGVAPLVVTLSDTSSGSITSRSWNLGDGTTATTQVVAKTYSNPGTYVVTLTDTGGGGSATASKSIAVAAPTVAGTTSTGTGGTTSTSSGGTTSTSSGGTTSTIASHTNGLVAAYGFEEPRDSEVIDASGNTNRGWVSGATRVTTTFFGRALKFDGKSNWVTINDSASLDFTKAMTLEAWVYPTALSGWRIVMMKEGAGDEIYSLYANTADRNRPAVGIKTTGLTAVYGTAQLPLNTWTYLAVTYDGMTLRTYVNGVLVATTPATGSLRTSTGALRIGGDSIWGEFFQGMIDEVRVYNRALTQAEIVADSKTAVVGLLLSKSPDRSNALPLNGLAVSGTIYVYYTHINPTAASNPVKQVVFWLDDPNPTYPSGLPSRTEQKSPYDFAGTADSGSAIGFDTARLAPGIHVITAQVTLSDGTILPFINGTFTIGPALQ